MILFSLIMQVSEGGVTTVNMPLWVAVLLAILGGIGVFWERIKSSYENWQNNNTSIKIKNIDESNEQKKSLEEQIKGLRIKLTEKDTIINKHEKRIEQQAQFIRTLSGIVLNIVTEERDKKLIEAVFESMNTNEEELN